MTRFTSAAPRPWTAINRPSPNPPSPCPVEPETPAPRVPERAARSESLRRILARQGVQFDRLDDLPPKTVRQAQRQAIFDDWRSIELPAAIIVHSLGRAILEDLLVTRIGSHSHGRGHYIPRPDGSLDHIWIYCVAGQGWCEMAGQSWTIPKDTVLLIPPHAPHYYGAVEEDPWSIYWIHFTGKASGGFRELLQTTAAAPLFHLDHSPAISSAHEAVFRPMSLAHTYNNLVAGSGALAHFLSTINLERYSFNLRSQTAQEKIDKTAEFMRENLGKRFSARQLAQIAHLSPAHYSTVFRRRYDHPPLEYFNRLKVQKACQLLTGTMDPIHRIARGLGFDDPYYFSRLFKRVVGVSPNHYRAGAGRSR